MRPLAGKSGARVDLKTMAMISSWRKKSELSREECQEVVEITSDKLRTIVFVAIEMESSVYSANHKP